MLEDFFHLRVRSAELVYGRESSLHKLASVLKYMLSRQRDIVRGALHFFTVHEHVERHRIVLCAVYLHSGQWHVFRTTLIEGELLDHAKQKTWHGSGPNERQNLHGETLELGARSNIEDI